MYYLTVDVIKTAYNELIKFNANSPGILHIFLILKGAGFNSETFEPETGDSIKGAEILKQRMKAFEKKGRVQNLSGYKTN